MKYELAEKAKQDRKVYVALKEFNVNDFIDSIIEEEKRTCNIGIASSEIGHWSNEPR